MGDENNYLFGGEEVVLVVRRHPVVLAKPSLVPFVGIIFVVGAPSMATFGIFVATALFFAYKFGLWWVDRFVLTTNRVLSTEGILTKSVVSMPLAKITDLMYTRSILGRMLGYGRLHLESAGQMGLESVDHLPDPDHFYRVTMSLALGPPTGKAPSQSDNKQGSIIQLDNADENGENDSRNQGQSLVKGSDD